MYIYFGLEYVGWGSLLDEHRMQDGQYYWEARLEDKAIDLGKAKATRIIIYDLDYFSIWIKD